MPFTLSHMVVAPPINKITRGKLPLAALCIGCMTPDLYRLFTSSDIAVTHQWSSVYSYNLVLGLFITLLWYYLYRPALFRFFNLSHPIELDSFRSYCSFIALSAVSIMIGASTHILWDGLTHLDYRTYLFYDFLGQKISIGTFNYPMHFILQIVFSIIALPPLYWMLRRYTLRHQRRRPCHQWVQHYAWGLLMLSLVSGAMGYYLFNQSITPELIRTDLYFYVGHSLNRFASYFLIVFSLGCLLFKVIDIKHTTSVY